MRLPTLFAGLTALMVAATPVAAQKVTDYLDLPGPITLGDTDYALAWSSQPAENYTKQEYLPAGQEPARYESMVLVETVTGTIRPGDAAAQQVNFLNERRASDPIANYQLLEHPQTGEIMLDFVLSSRDTNGEYIIEWNGYRYAPLPDGQPGVLLFGISHRAYGNTASEAFLRNLTAFKEAQLAILAAAPLPAL